MFIGLNVNPRPNSVRRSGVQPWLYHSRTNPLLRTEPEGLAPFMSINMSPLTG